MRLSSLIKRTFPSQSLRRKVDDKFKEPSSFDSSLSLVQKYLPYHDNSYFIPWEERRRHLFQLSLQFKNTNRIFSCGSQNFSLSLLLELQMELCSFASCYLRKEDRTFIQLNFQRKSQKDPQSAETETEINRRKFLLILFFRDLLCTSLLLV